MISGPVRTLILLFTLALAACSTAPPVRQQPDMREILASNAVKQGSGKSEILQVFGEPENRNRLPASTGESVSGLPIAHEMWVYSWVENAGENTEPRLKTLVFHFDRQGRVIDYTASDNSL